VLFIGIFGQELFEGTVVETNNCREDEDCQLSGPALDMINGYSFLSPQALMFTSIIKSSSSRFASLVDCGLVVVMSKHMHIGIMVVVSSSTVVGTVETTVVFIVVTSVVVGAVVGKVVSTVVGGGVVNTDVVGGGVVNTVVVGAVVTAVVVLKVVVVS